MKKPNKFTAIYQAFIVKRNAAKRENKQAAERARLIAKYQPSFEVRSLIETLSNNSFVPTGEFDTGFTRIFTLSNQNQMVWIQTHLSDGRLVRVFREVNENNPSVLAEKLTIKDSHIINAHRAVNAALVGIATEYPPEREAAEPLPEFLIGVRQWLNEAGTELLKIENI